jgi:predicted CopG family antitoxin
MHRKLTITLSDDVYEGLYRTVNRGRISSFIEDLVRPHVVSSSSLEDQYRAMAADREREEEATAWVEGLSGETLE